MIYIHVAILMKLKQRKTMVLMLQSFNSGNILRMRTVIILMILITLSSESHNETLANDTSNSNSNEDVTTTTEENDYDDSNVHYIHSIDDDDSSVSFTEHGRKNERNGTVAKKRSKNKYRKHPGLRQAVKDAALQGLSAMIDLYERREPEIYKKGSNLIQFIKISLINSKFQKFQDSI